METGRQGWKVGNGEHPVYVGKWRWTEPETGWIGKMGKAYRSLLAIHDRRWGPNDRLADLLADETGHRRLVKQAIDDLKTIKRARLVSSEAYDFTVEQRFKHKPVEIDPHDAAAAIARMDLRRTIAAMAPPQRTKFINEQQGDARLVVLDAILEVPAIVSGVGEQLYGRLLDEAMERRHGDLVSGLNEVLAAAETLDRAVGAAGLLVQRQTIEQLQLAPGDFRQIESQADAALAA